MRDLASSSPQWSSLHPRVCRSLSSQKGNCIDPPRQFSHHPRRHPSSLHLDQPRSHYRKMAPVNVLSDDSDSGEDLDQITINDHYAKAYAYRKERQELERREHSFFPCVPFTIPKHIRLLLISNHARLHL